ncbi:hypothetical protein WDW37_17640 [Bdellovibrionota bacterium FG-1]
MTETNEQTTVRLGEAIRDSHVKLNELFTNLCTIAGSDAPDAQKQTELLRIYGEANRQFNNVERFVADSELLGAHDRPLWVTNTAETCANFLRHIRNFFMTIRAIGKTVGMAPEMFAPDALAYTSMQQLTKTHLAAEAAMIRADFHANALPTQGFDREPPKELTHSSLLMETTADKHIVKMENVSSHAAAKVAASRTAVHVKDKGATSGPIDGKDAVAITERLSGSSATPKHGWFRSNVEEFKNKGIAGVLVKLIAATLIGAFGIYAAGHFWPMKARGPASHRDGR